MVGSWPLSLHHDHLQYIHHIHLMQRGQNRGVTDLFIANLEHMFLLFKFLLEGKIHLLEDCWVVDGWLVG